MYLQRTEDWPLAQKMLKEQKVHDFQVVFVNRGGVRGDLAGIEAFMPFSKMCTGLGGLNAAQRYKQLTSKLPGLKLRVKVVMVRQLATYLHAIHGCWSILYAFVPMVTANLC